MTNVDVSFQVNVIDSEQAVFNWRAILFNCNCHTFDVVIDRLMKAIPCSRSKAGHLASVAHHTGSVKVYEGDKESCERVADVLGASGLLVSVSK